jgi:hypothetical protein
MHKINLPVVGSVWILLTMDKRALVCKLQLQSISISYYYQGYYL